MLAGFRSFIHWFIHSAASLGLTRPMRNSIQSNVDWIYFDWTWIGYSLGWFRPMKMPQSRLWLWLIIIIINYYDCGRLRSSFIGTTDEFLLIFFLILSKFELLLLIELILPSVNERQRGGEGEGKGEEGGRELVAVSVTFSSCFICSVGSIIILCSVRNGLQRGALPVDGGEALLRCRGMKWS